MSNVSKFSPQLVSDGAEVGSGLSWIRSLFQRDYPVFRVLTEHVHLSWTENVSHVVLSSDPVRKGEIQSYLMLILVE